MGTEFARIEKEALALEPREKAALARMLLKNLDATMDPDVEAAWVAEAERRYEAYKAGEEEAVPGDEAMARARKALK